MSSSLFVRRADATAEPDAAARWCLISDGDLILLRQPDGLRLPDTHTLHAHDLHPQPIDLLGAVGDNSYFVGELPDVAIAAPFERVDLRRAYDLLDETEYMIAGFGTQIAHWDATERFCSRCATALDRVPNERAKRCPHCGLSDYPRVSPCIIVLIYRDGEVLLARKPEWPPNRYSLVAGFVEPGESLEACLRREVLEEVGVTVDHITYLGSQPWPFPHQVMIGYVAHYASGEIALDETELQDAKWFDLDDLPLLPPPLSIARKIIDWFVQRRNDPTLAFPEL